MQPDMNTAHKDFAAAKLISYQVDTDLSQIRVKLARETKRRGHARHDSRDQMVQVAGRWSSQLQSSLADVVQSLIVNTEGRVRVLHQLVNGQGGVVRLYNSIRGLSGRVHTEGSQHAVREFCKGGAELAWLQLEVLSDLDSRIAKSTCVVDSYLLESWTAARYPCRIRYLHRANE